VSRNGSGATGVTALNLDGGNASVTSAAQSGTRTFTIPMAASDTFVLQDHTQTLTNKTIPNGSGNSVAAQSLNTVAVSGTPPSAGQALVASSSTTASWTTLSGGGGGVDPHASTHLPGGSDALATGVAVSVGTSNAEGSAA